MTNKTPNKAILHIDGDAFFASCEQSRHPELKGVPVVTGKERGIASSMSYEAKAAGVTRGMPLWQIKKTCPNAVILPSDYETYSLLSERLFSITRRYTPLVEEYGIDECFADLTGQNKPSKKTYEELAKEIKNTLDRELGFTFSIGLAPTKVLAKIGSKWKKPSGLTILTLENEREFLSKWPVEKIWGIGPATTDFLHEHKIYSSAEFAEKPQYWVKHYLSKPFVDIWRELNGESVLPVNCALKTSYGSIQKFKTFTPPSSELKYIFAQLAKNIENACIKARRYNQAAQNAVIILRTQQFEHQIKETKFHHPTNLPTEIIKTVEPLFHRIFNPFAQYRATGIVLVNLVPTSRQTDIFGSHILSAKFTNAYTAADKLSEKYGKHAIFLGASFMAHKYGAHAGARGDLPERQIAKIKGETKRRRLGLPMLFASV